MIKSFISKRIPKGSFVHSVTLIAGGTAIAQLLNAASMPVLSRIYTPEDFGVLVLLLSLSAILVEVTGLRYDLAIPLPKDTERAQHLVVLSVLIQCIFFVFVFLSLFLFGNSFLSLISAESLIPYRFILPLSVAGTGLYLTMTQWAIREKEFALISRTRLTQSISGITVKTGLGLLGFQPLGLLLGSVASYSGGLFTLMRRLITKKGRPKADWGQLKHVAVEYRDFPLFSMWAGLFNTLGRRMVPLLLVALYGLKTAGLFAFGMQLLEMPTALVGKAVGQVFLQRASEAAHQGNLAEISLRAVDALLWIGLFPLLFLSLLAPELFSVIFGESWRTAGFYSLLLGPWLALGFIYAPLTSLFSILRKQRESMLFEFFYLGARAVAIYCGFRLYGDALVSVGLFGITSFIFLCFLLIWLLRSCGNSKKAIAKMLAGSWVLIALLLPVAALRFLDVGLLVWILVSTTCVIVFAWMLYSRWVSIKSIMIKEKG